MTQPLNPTVEVEEDLYAFTDAKNGGGPQWCFGSPMLVRLGDKVWAVGRETIPDAKPLNNTRWNLYARPDKGPSELVYRDMTGRTREPCPMGAFPDGRLFVTANPTIGPLDAYSGPAEPQVFEFAAAHPASPTQILKPSWSEKVTFTEHSYRSFAVDGANREFVYINNIGYDLAHWSFYDRQGQWSASGKVVWPRHDLDGKSIPLRVCYPSVALHNRAVFIYGISDIVEFNPDYKAFKFQLTKSEWDYVFCRAFYSWTPDITREPFRPWVEVANREETRGTMLVCDLWVGPDGVIHLLWRETTIDERLVEKFFPGQQAHWQLNYAQVRDGQISRRQTIINGDPSPQSPRPLWGRFHVTPSGRLLVVATVQVPTAHGQRITENQVLELDGQGKPGPAQPIKLDHPFAQLFFTATPRGGSTASPYLDLLGECSGRPDVIRYARVRVE